MGTQSRRSYLRRSRSAIALTRDTRSTVPTSPLGLFLLAISVPFTQSSTKTDAWRAYSARTALLFSGHHTKIKNPRAADSLWKRRQWPGTLRSGWCLPWKGGPAGVAADNTRRTSKAAARFGIRTKGPLAGVGQRAESCWLGGIGLSVGTVRVAPFYSVAR
jgi:hypothetical protein